MGSAMPEEASSLDTVAMNYSEAKADAVWGEMRRDPKILVWGTDTKTGLGLGGPAAFREFGPSRLFDAPISENAMVGIGIGAAMMGYRPIVNMMMANFATYAFDQIINQASRVRYLFGGQAQVPMVMYMGMQSVAAGGSHHTDRTYPLLMNVPGLKIVCPTTPTNAKGLWTTAIRDDAPVVIYESNAVSVRREPVPQGEFTIPFGKGEIVRSGDDVTLVTIFTRTETLAAADELAAEGVSADVIDPRTLVPLDLDLILESVGRTGRLVIADAANACNGAASHIAALVADHGFELLRAPIKRVCTPDVHIPHARVLEKKVFPTRGRIRAAVLEVLEKRPAVSSGH